MGITWQSDEKSWDYRWKIGKHAILMRYNDTLDFSFSRSSGPASLLALMNLIHNPKMYVPVLQYDVKLQRKGVSVAYGSFSDGDEYSYIYRDLFPDIINLAEESGVNSKILYKNRKVEEVPSLVDILKNIEEKSKPRNLDEELMDDLVRHRKFCEVLVKNKSGLRVS